MEGLRDPKAGCRGFESGSRTEIMAVSRYRMLALDVDGTLLDPDGTLRPRTAEAVARAARAGMRPVLCTGRRYRRARPIAELLGLDAPLVCNSGAIVKEPADHRTLWRTDFDPELAAEVLELFRDHDHPSVVFTDRDPDDFDFIIPAFPTGRKPFDDYVAKNREHAEIDPAGGVRPSRAFPSASRCIMSRAIGARPDAGLGKGGPGSDGWSNPDVRAPHLAIPRNDVRNSTCGCEQVDCRPPPGRAMGHRAG